MTRTKRRTKTAKQKIFDKKLKIHQIAYQIAKSKNELEKQKLRKQLKRQCNILKVMGKPSNIVNTSIRQVGTNG